MTRNLGPGGRRQRRITGSHTFPHTERHCRNPVGKPQRYKVIQQHQQAFFLAVDGDNVSGINKAKRTLRHPPGDYNNTSAMN